MRISPLIILMLFALSAWSGCKSNDPPVSVQKGAESGGLDTRFTTIQVDIRKERLELFLYDDAGHTFKRFDRLKSWLANRNEQLRFAMNAGMFQPDFTPVGLLVQDGKQ